MLSCLCHVLHKFGHNGFQYFLHCCRTFCLLCFAVHSTLNCKWFPVQAGSMIQVTARWNDPLTKVLCHRLIYWQTHSRTAAAIVETNCRSDIRESREDSPTNKQCLMTLFCQMKGTASSRMVYKHYVHFWQIWQWNGLLQSLGDTVEQMPWDLVYFHVMFIYMMYSCSNANKNVKHQFQRVSMCFLCIGLGKSHT